MTPCCPTNPYDKIKPMTNYFCAFPFEHMEIKPSGDAFICCSGRLPLRVGNLHSQTIRECWNSETAQDIRRTMRDGSFFHCTRCKYPIDKFGSVKPVEEHPPHLRVFAAEGNDPPLPRRIMLSLDRTCQLQCPSCRTSRIRAPERLNAAIDLQNTILDDPDITEIESIWTSGSGEPFVSALDRDLLMNRMGEDKFRNTIFGVQTNGLLFKRRWHEMPETNRKRLQGVSVSVDAGSPDTYQENRGADWAELIENLLFMSELKKAGQLKRFKMQYAVQSNNWREMADFVRIAVRLGCDRVGFLAMRNWNTFTQLDYRQRAVHLTHHREHQMFVDSLRNPIFSHPIVRQRVLPLT